MARPQAAAKAAVREAAGAVSAVRVVLVAPVRHDGVDFAPGETLVLAADQAAALVAAGAAEAAETE